MVFFSVMQFAERVERGEAVAAGRARVVPDVQRSRTRSRSHSAQSARS